MGKQDKHEKNEVEAPVSSSEPKEDASKVVVVAPPPPPKWENSNHYADPIEVGEKGIENFTVILPWRERNEILAAARATHGEIAGWAEAEVDHVNRTIRLGRIAIPEQEAGAANAEILGEQTHELALAGEIDLQKAIVSWHSHVNMEAAPSGIDKQSYRKLSDMMPVFLAIVMNKKNVWWAEVWLKTAMGPLRFKPDIDFEDPMPAPMDHIKELVKTRLKEKVYVLPPLHGSQHTRFNRTCWRGDRFYVDEVLQVWSRDAQRFVDAPKGYTGVSGCFGTDPLKDSPEKVAESLKKFSVSPGKPGLIWEFLGVSCFPLSAVPRYDCEETLCSSAALFSLVFSETPGPKSYCSAHMMAIRDVLVKGESKIAKERARRQKKDGKQLLLPAGK